MIFELLMAIVHTDAGSPYIRGGHSPAGSDCSGLVSQLANVVSGRDPFATRFATPTEGAELAARGFSPGTAPHALVVGWNSIHTAATLPDGTPVESGGPLGGGVKVGKGKGAYQAQFDHHMYLKVSIPWWTGDDAPRPKKSPPPVPPAPPPVLLMGFLAPTDEPDKIS